MISDREFFRNFGFELEIEPAKADFFIEETPARNFLGAEFQVLEVPGHCPGSLCFFSRKDNLLIGGGGLFSRGGGRLGVARRRGRLFFLRSPRQTFSPL